MLPVYCWVPAAWLLIQTVQADGAAKVQDREMRAFGSLSLPSKPRTNIVRFGTPLTLDRNSKHAVVGRFMARTYELFVNWLNDVRGGINIGGVWHKAEMVLVGDESDAALAKDITRYLIEELNITLLLGPYSSTITKPVADMASSLGATMLAPAASAPFAFVDNPQVFGILTPASKILIPAFAAVGTRVRSVAIFREDTPYTNSVCDAIPALTSQYGMEVVGLDTGLVLSASPTAQEVTDAVAALKAANPEFLVGCVYATACKAILKELRVQDFSPLQVVSTICVTSPGFAEELGIASRFVSGLTPWTPNMPFVSDLNSWTVSYYAEYFKTMYDEVPPYQSASTWACGEALVTAIERAGSADPAKVAAQLAKLNIDTVFGRVKFDENGQNANPYKVVQFKEESDVNPRVVFPPFVATDDMMFPMPTWENRACFQEFPTNSFYGYYGDNICGRCPETQVGHFDAALQKRVCKGCEADKTAFATGFEQRSCFFQCPPGEVNRGQNTDVRECVRCGYGKYRKGYYCDTCPEGKYSYAGDEACRDCLEGRFVDEIGKSGCLLCPKGKQIDALGSNFCDPCPPGKFTNRTGSTACILCGRGMVAEATASSQCEICARGSYSSYDASRCEQCEPGKYSNQFGIRECIPIVEGARADSYGMVNPDNQERYWQNNSWHGGEWYAESWEWCVKLPKACLSDQKCKEGHTGRQCGSCLPRWYDSGGECHECWSRWWYAIATAFMITFLTVLIGGLAVFLKKGANRPQDVHSIVYKQLINHVILASVVSKLLQEAYSHLPNPSLGPVEWGYFLLYFTHWGYGVFPSENGIWSVTCLTEARTDGEDALQEKLRNARHYDYTNPAFQDAWEALRERDWDSEIRYACFWIIFPFFMIFFACSLGYIALFWKISRNRDDYFQALDFYSSVYTIGFRSAQKKVLRERCARYTKLYYKQVLQLWSPVHHIRCYQNNGHIDFQQWLRECLPVRSAVIFQTFGCVLYGCVRAVRCTPIKAGEGETVVVVNSARREVVCQFGSSLFVIPMIGLFFWCVLYPAFLFSSLRQVRKKKVRGKQTPEAIVDFALFMNGYRPECWYWEVVMYLKKAWVIAIAAVPFDLWHVEARPLAFLLTGIFFAVLQLIFKPYDQRCNGLLNSMEKYQLAWWLLAACGLTALQNDTEFPMAYALLPIVLLVLHWLYFLKALYHMFQSICISLVSTDPGFRPDYIKAMDRTIWRRLKEIILKSAMADWGQSKPYIALDPYYGWVTLIGKVINDRDMKAPHIVKGAEARKDTRFMGSRPPLSMVGKLVQEDFSFSKTVHSRASISNDDDDYLKTPTRGVPNDPESRERRRQERNRSRFERPDQRQRRELNDVISQVMGHLATGNIDADGKTIDPETGQPQLASQTFSVSILDFIIRAAFVLHKQQKDVKFMNFGEHDSEDVDPEYWKEANRQRNPLMLLTVDEETKAERQRREKQERQSKVAMSNTDEADNQEDMDDLEDEFLQEAGKRMQDELRDYNQRVIMSRSYSLKVREAENLRRTEAEKMEAAIRGGGWARGAKQLKGNAWGLPTTLSLIQSEADRIIGQGTNDNGIMSITGRGNVNGSFMLEVTNKKGTFLIELKKSTIGGASKGEYVGKTLDSGYEGKTCKFLTIHDEEDGQADGPRRANEGHEAGEQAVNKAMDATHTAEVSPTKMVIRSVKTCFNRLRFFCCGVPMQAPDEEPPKEEEEGLEDVDQAFDAQAQAELEKAEENFRKTKRREHYTKVVDKMFSPNLFNRNGLRLEDLQNLALRLQRLPKEEMIDWLDLFEDRWSVETVRGNAQLMHLAGFMSGEDDPEETPYSQADGVLVSKATQFPEKDELEKPKETTLDDFFKIEAAPIFNYEGASEGGPVPRSAMVLVHQTRRFHYTWEEHLRHPLMKKLKALRQTLGISLVNWVEDVEVVDKDGKLVPLNSISHVHEEHFPLTVKFVDKSRPDLDWRDGELNIALRWVHLSMKAAGGLVILRPHMIRDAVQRRVEAAKDTDLDHTLEDLRRQRSAEARNLAATVRELAELQAALEAQHSVTTPHTSRPDADAAEQSGIRKAGDPTAQPKDIAAHAPVDTEPVNQAKSDAGSEDFIDFPVEIRKRARAKRSCRVCGFGGGFADDESETQI